MNIYIYGEYIFEFVLPHRVQHQRSQGPHSTDIEGRVWAYIGGIARKHEVVAVQVGGIENHIHVLILAKPKVAPSQIVQWLKGESSRWIHETFDELSLFEWQDGVFTVSKQNVPRVVEYIKNQRVHHAAQTFEEEYISMLTMSGTEYDERYLFD